MDEGVDVVDVSMLKSSAAELRTRHQAYLGPVSRGINLTAKLK